MCMMSGVSSVEMLIHLFTPARGGEESQDIIKNITTIHSTYEAYMELYKGEITIQACPCEKSINYGYRLQDRIQKRSSAMKMINRRASSSGSLRSGICRQCEEIVRFQDGYPDGHCVEVYESACRHSVASWISLISGRWSAHVERHSIGVHVVPDTQNLVASSQGQQPLRLRRAVPCC